MCPDSSCTALSLAVPGVSWTSPHFIMRSNLCHYFLFIPSGLLSVEDHIEGNFWHKSFPCLPLRPQQPAEVVVLALHLQMPLLRPWQTVAFLRKGTLFSVCFINLFNRVYMMSASTRCWYSSMKRLMGHQTCGPAPIVRDLGLSLAP